MGSSKMETVFMVLLCPIAVPVYFICWAGSTTFSTIKASWTYLFDAAWNDFLHFIETCRIRFGPQRSMRHTIIRERNAKIYEPFAAASGGMRVVKLLPRRSWPDSGIQCEVTRVTRGEVQYEALSYACDDLELCRTIKVNNQHFMVTKTLHSALQHLRADQTRTLWIDALCVNELDGCERNDQVQQMASTFRGATGVVAWLGQTPKGFARLMPLFDGPPSAVFEDDQGPMAHIFSDLLRRPWFNSLRAVQELALPPKVIVQCGRYRVPWNNFAQIIELFWKDSNHSNELSRARDMAQVRSKWQSGITHENERLGLAWQFRDRHVTDDRDRLYALLGLLSLEDGDFRVDYSKDVEDVSRDFAQAWINRHGSLLILNLTQRQQRSHGSSWYPVWSKPFDANPQFFCGSAFNSHSRNFWEGKFSADGGRRAPNCTVPGTSNMIRVQGFTHDTVAAVAPLLDEADLNRARAIWLDCVKTFAQTWSPGTTADELNRQLGLAMTAGLAESGSETVNHELVQRATCEKRRLFITRNGELGVGPSQTAAGDKVCVVFGSPAPFILSECKTCDSRGGREGDDQDPITPGQPNHAVWRFSGDAYVHSIMNYSRNIDEDVSSGKLLLEDFMLCT